MIPSKLYRYSIDTFNGRFVNGWCFHRLYKKRRLKISIVADGRLIGTTETGEYRRDLKSQKLHATGLCGFDFSFPADFMPDRFQSLEIYVTGLDKPLFNTAGNEVETLIPDPAQKICFMHIPKTAGSSFNAFLRRCYPQAVYAPHLERMPKEIRESITASKICVSGHLPWYEIKSLVEKTSHGLYSIIREPYRHLHSHINYVRRVATDSEDEANYEYKHNDTIRGLAEKLMQVDFGDDTQIRNFVDTIAGYERDFFDNIQTRYFLDYRPEKVRLEDFENAQENIRRFRLIGLTEEYDRFVERFCQDLRLPPQTELQSSNISDHYQLFDPLQESAINPLHELVTFDQQLYRSVSDFFWENSGK
jgi:hypothetical protein